MPQIYLKSDLYDEIIRRFPDRKVGEVVEDFVKNGLKGKKRRKD